MYQKRAETTLPVLRHHICIWSDLIGEDIHYDGEQPYTRGHPTGYGGCLPDHQKCREKDALYERNLLCLLIHQSKFLKLLFLNVVTVSWIWTI